MSLIFLALAACVGDDKCIDGETESGECASASAECSAVAGATMSVSPGEGTIAAALSAAVSGDIIELLPGDYADEDMVVPAGVAVVGRCDVALAVPSDATGFSLTDADGARVANLDILGGAPAIDLTASVPSAVTLADLSISSSGSYGVRVAGSVTLTASGLSVSDTLPRGDGTLGRGLSLQAGAVATLAGGTFAGNREASVFVDASTLTLDAGTVTDTLPRDDGRYGRGVHAQNASVLTVENLVVSGSHDAGICTLDSSMTVTGGTISDTIEGVVEGGTSGEGIAAFGSSGTVQVTDVTLSGNARAGILADGVAVEAAGASLSGNAYSFVGQNGGSVACDGCTVADDELELAGVSGVDALPIYDEPME